MKVKLADAQGQTKRDQRESAKAAAASDRAAQQINPKVEALQEVKADVSRSTSQMKAALKRTNSADSRKKEAGRKYTQELQKRKAGLKDTKSTDQVIKQELAGVRAKTEKALGTKTQAAVRAKKARLEFIEAKQRAAQYGAKVRQAEAMMRNLSKKSQKAMAKVKKMASELNQDPNNTLDNAPDAKGNTEGEVERLFE